MPERSIRKPFTLTAEVPPFAGLVDCRLHTPLRFLVENSGPAATVRLIAESREGLISRFETELAVPCGGEARLAVPDLFSPTFLAGGGVRRASVAVRLFCGERALLCIETPVTVLPYGVWEGLAGDAARLAAFADPRSEDVARLLTMAREMGKRRNGLRFGGYKGEKNDAKELLFCVFSALRACLPVRAEADFCSPVPVCCEKFSAGGRTANALTAGLIACSCLEAAGYHPVLAVGKRRVGVGVWLYDSGFLARSTEDGGSVRAYLEGGRENLAFFDADDLFCDKKTSFAQSERRFLREMEEEFRVFVDISRCRREGFAPEPPREDPPGGTPPAPRSDFSPFPSAASKSAAWERRLVDLSARNPLLNFTGKGALRLSCTDGDALLLALGEDGMRLVAGGEKGEEGRERELESLERARGALRVYAEEGEMNAAAARMLRAEREAEEEAGAGVLYLSFSLLCFPANGKGEQRAPVALYPVSLARDRDGVFTLRAREGGFFLNPALAEYLADRFGREPTESPLLSSLAEVTSFFRAQTAEKEGWMVTEEVYLAALSFHGYEIWNDLKRNMPEFEKNKLVRALLEGKADRGVFSAEEECPAGAPKILLPSDLSQDEAVALSDRGCSFVLHGPPGTGKSQTIANIIANALDRGKRVLFVAEKKAALDVVRRRLESIGLGDFCLEADGAKADRVALARKIEQTISLLGEVSPDSSAAEAELSSLKGELGAPLSALHASGRLGTPYEAVLQALARRDAFRLGGRDVFYASLTEEGLSECRHALVSAAAAAGACGGLRGAPFEGVELFAYSEAARDAIVCSCRALLAASANAERMLALFFEFYCQRVPLFTAARLSAVLRLATRLKSGADDLYFRGVTAEELQIFRTANEEFDARLGFYLRRFRALPETEEGETLARYAREGGDWRLSAGLRAVARRLSRLALLPLEEEDIPKALKTLAEINVAAERIKGINVLSDPFCGRDGRILLGERKKFLAGYSALHALAAEAFPEYDADAFDGAYVRASGGCALPVLGGVCSAVEEFFSARQAFLRATGGREGESGGDVLKESAEKAAALLENIDLLRGWCRCREALRRLENEGVGAVSEALARGLGEKALVAAFEGEAYRRYLEECILARPELAGFTAGVLEERAGRYRAAAEGVRRLQVAQVRAGLLARVPRGSEIDPAERSAIYQAARGKGSGGVRGLFAAAPRLVAAAGACMLMSPAAVARYLPPVANAFDLVIFDEASQMTSAEAAGSIARARAAIVVGDPNQLPPTRFFCAGRGEEEAFESVLDEFLALGMPERKLRWHYRSRHESLIAFSNAAYYRNSLFTVPSPEEKKSRVKLVRVDGVYDRGGAKRNRREAEALVAEVVRRLSDPHLAKMSLGVVTFSVPQREEIEKLLSRALSERRLEEVAYRREEPLFIKNLENVQGDERDVILFSVCYGPDGEGKVTLNFGPLNRSDGWRRLNVAASRAREEMLVFSSLSPAAIEADRTPSRGAAELKAFLEFAENGKTLSDIAKTEGGIGGYIARELSACGYSCRLGVGASAFRVDVAVLDPRDPEKYLLAVLTDGDGTLSVKERYLVREEALARAGWRIARVESIAFYADPKRETERLKGILDGLCGRKRDARLARYERRYRYARTPERGLRRAISEEEGAEEARARLREIVLREQPISRAFLKKRFAQETGMRGGRRAFERLDRLIDGCAFPTDFAAGVQYFYLSPRAISFDRYRTEGKNARRRTVEDYTVYEIVSMIRGALEDEVALYPDDLSELFGRAFRVKRAEGELAAFLMKCVRYGEEKGIFARSPSERITLRS